MNLTVRGWGGLKKFSVGEGAAGTLKPLNQTIFSSILQPYPSLDTKNPCPLPD